MTSLMNSMVVVPQQQAQQPQLLNSFNFESTLQKEIAEVKQELSEKVKKVQLMNTQVAETLQKCNAQCVQVTQQIEGKFQDFLKQLTAKRDSLIEQVQQYNQDTHRKLLVQSTAMQTAVQAISKLANENHILEAAAQQGSLSLSTQSQHHNTSSTNAIILIRHFNHLKSTSKAIDNPINFYKPSEIKFVCKNNELPELKTLASVSFAGGAAAEAANFNQLLASSNPLYSSILSSPKKLKFAWETQPSNMTISGTQNGSWITFKTNAITSVPCACTFQLQLHANDNNSYKLVVGVIYGDAVTNKLGGSELIGYPGSGSADGLGLVVGPGLMFAHGKQLPAATAVGKCATQDEITILVNEKYEVTFIKNGKDTIIADYNMSAKRNNRDLHFACSFVHVSHSATIKNN